MNKVNQFDMNEAQADAIEKDLHSFSKDTKTCNLPKPPKPGEIMYCQFCGKPMLPKDFSKDEKTRKKEFKWHIHNKCMIAMSNMADLKTHGLMAERKRRDQATERNKHDLQNR